MRKALSISVVGYPTMQFLALMAVQNARRSESSDISDVSEWRFNTTMRISLGTIAIWEYWLDDPLCGTTK